jgi:hypothetical protein
VALAQGAGCGVAGQPRKPLGTARGDLSSEKPKVLGGGKADREGGFRVDVLRPSGAGALGFVVVAGGAGHGLGWQFLDPDTDKPTADLLLTPERVILGRFVDVQGQPAVGSRSVSVPSGLRLELVVTPGALSYDLKRLYEKGEPAADSAYVGNIDQVNYREAPVTDTEGGITFPALIPGATYRIVEVGDRNDMVKCEFKAVSGKTVRLPEVVRKEGR